MAMTVTESTAHECRLILYFTIWLAVAQGLVRVLDGNGLFTTFLLAVGITIISTIWQGDHVNPINLQNSAFRSAADVIGFLSGIVGFLSLLVISETKELVFTPETLLTIISAGGLSISHIFLTFGLTYTSNMSLFSSFRFVLNSSRIISNLFGAHPVAPVMQPAAPQPAAPQPAAPQPAAPQPAAPQPAAPQPAPRGRGRPRGGGGGRR